MKVVAYAQTDGCGLYRLRHPIAALQAAGHDVTIGGSIPVIGVEYEGGASRVVGADIDADVVILQRPMDAELIQMIPILQRQGIAVVVEIDDDFHALPKGHPARKLSSSIHNPTRNRRWLRHACETADLVTVSTPALADRYGAHGRVRVLRNLIPAAYLNIEAKRTGYWVGWTGSTDTHVNDLTVVGTAVADVLAANRPWGFRVVGPPTDVAEQLGVKIEATGWVRHLDHPHSYARLDVAVAPLQMNPFNEAKSWLKVLEAAALGVPVIGSPTSEYRKADRLGLCWTAVTPADWAEQLTFLLRDPVARRNKAEVARAAAAGLTYEEHAWTWWEAWDQAISNHRQRSAA